MVLKKIILIRKDSRGKWTQNYKGPFVVVIAFSGGALILATMDGDEFPLLTNVDAVKKVLFLKKVGYKYKKFANSKT